MSFGIIPSILIINTALLCWILNSMPSTNEDRSVITFPHNDQDQQESLGIMSDSLEGVRFGTPPVAPPSYDETMGPGYLRATPWPIP